MLAPAARATLRIDSHVIQPTALEGLETFSHVWLLYDFHENTNAAKLAQPSGQTPQLKAKVHPPGLSGEKIGLFATRTPHRPSPIGLSVARLLEVRGDTLVLGGADLVDGTPILDIKPCEFRRGAARASLPAQQRPHHCGRPRRSTPETLRSSTRSRTHSRTAACARSDPPRWLADSSRAMRPPRQPCTDLRHDIQPDASVPRWCEQRLDASSITAVKLSPAAEAGLAAAAPALRFFDDAAGARAAIVQMLQLDIRSVHQGRGSTQSAEGQQYCCRIDELELAFTTFETHVLVTACQLRQAASPAPAAAAKLGETNKERNKGRGRKKERDREKGH